MVAVAWVALQALQGIWPVAYTLTSELFPTEVRATANGLAHNLLGRWGRRRARSGWSLAAVFGSTAQAVTVLALVNLLALPLLRWGLPETRAARVAVEPHGDDELTAAAAITGMNRAAAPGRFRSRRDSSCSTVAPPMDCTSDVDRLTPLRGQSHNTARSGRCAGNGETGMSSAARESAARSRATMSSHQVLTVRASVTPPSSNTPDFANRAQLDAARRSEQRMLFDRARGDARPVHEVCFVLAQHGTGGRGEPVADGLGRRRVIEPELGRGIERRLVR